MKQTGSRGELLVAEKLIANGWVVSWPIGDSEPFDLLASKGEKTLKIQVKSTLRPQFPRGKGQHYQFHFKHGAGKARSYEPGTVDVFVCVALDTKRFWVIDCRDKPKPSMKIYGAGSKYAQTEDNWAALEKPA